MSKIVNEIIENIPELEKDKKDLNNTVSFLEANNPEIKASKEFKKNLKTRIKWIISIKQSDKKSLFKFFAIPAFSFIFVMWWFLYHFKDIDFFIDGNKLQKHENVDMVEIEEFWNIFEEELRKVVNENFEEEIDREDNKSVKTLVAPFKQRSINLDNNNVDMKKDILIENQDFTEEEDSTIENDEILEILSWIEWELEEDFSDIQSDEWFMIKGASFMEDDNFGSSYTEIEVNFDDFCMEKWWEITWDWELKKCILNEKQCFSSGFINWTCEFIEIN